MVERKVTYRAAVDGGARVKAEFQGIGRAGKQASDDIAKGQKSAEASAKAMSRQIDAEERAFRALKASIDPVFRQQQQLERVQAQLNRQVRLGIVGQKEAAAVLKQYEMRQRGVAAAMELTDTATRGANHGLRNTLLQVNQIGQQAAATGNIMGAVAIQLPDILGGFGGIAPLIIGAAVGLGTALIPKLFETKEAVQNLGDEAHASLSQAQSAADAARTAQERYAQAIRLSQTQQDVVTPAILQNLALEARAREAIARLQNLQLERDRRSLAESLRQNRETLAKAMADATHGLRTAAGQAMVDQNLVALAAIQKQLSIVSASVNAENEELVLIIQEQQAKLDLVNAALTDAELNASATVDALIDAANEGERLGRAISVIDLARVGNQAAFLAGQMGVAADNAVRYNAALNRAAGLSKPAPASPRLSYNLPGAANAPLPPSTQLSFGGPSTYADPNQPPLRTVIPMAPAAAAGGGGGGAGANDALKERNALLREGQSLYESLRTPMEQYNADMERAKQLLDAGAISQDTYNRRVAQLKEALQKASAENQAFASIQQQTRSAVLDTAMGIAGSWDRVRDAIKRAALEYLLFRQIGGQPVAGGIGGFLSGLGKAVLGGLPSFDGGGYTGSGPRSGGLDGRGGFLAVMHRNETVTDHSRPGAARNRRDGDPMVPFVAMGDGVKVQWMRESQARSMGMMRSGFTAQRNNMGAAISDLQMRGV